jgi:hypothetical protein
MHVEANHFLSSNVYCKPDQVANSSYVPTEKVHDTERLHMQALIR